MTVTAQHLVGQTPRCRSARLALPATPSALAWQGSLGLDQPAERTALWLFRGLKLIKELRLAFISSCVPAIYMLMPALPLRRSPARAGPRESCPALRGSIEGASGNSVMHSRRAPPDSAGCAIQPRLEVAVFLKTFSALSVWLTRVFSIKATSYTA